MSVIGQIYERNKPSRHQKLSSSAVNQILQEADKDGLTVDERLDILTILQKVDPNELMPHISEGNAAKLEQKVMQGMENAKAFLKLPREEQRQWLSAIDRRTTGWHVGMQKDFTFGRTAADFKLGARATQNVEKVLANLGQRIGPDAAKPRSLLLQRITGGRDEVYGYRASVAFPSKSGQGTYYASVLLNANAVPLDQPIWHGLKGVRSRGAAKVSGAKYVKQLTTRRTGKDQDQHHGRVSAREAIQVLAHVRADGNRDVAERLAMLRLVDNARFADSADRHRITEEALRGMASAKDFGKLPPAQQAEFLRRADLSQLTNGLDFHSNEYGSVPRSVPASVRARLQAVLKDLTAQANRDPRIQDSSPWLQLRTLERNGEIYGYDIWATYGSKDGGHQLTLRALVGPSGKVAGSDRPLFHETWDP